MGKLAPGRVDTNSLRRRGTPAVHRRGNSKGKPPALPGDGLLRAACRHVYGRYGSGQSCGVPPGS